MGQEGTLRVERGTTLSRRVKAADKDCGARNLQGKEFPRIEEREDPKEKKKIRK